MFLILFCEEGKEILDFQNRRLSLCKICVGFNLL